MSRKQNLKKAEKQREAKRKELNEIDKHLLKTKFPLEVESLPIEKLTKTEQNIANKCRNKEELDYEEYTILKKLLGKYRKIIHKMKPRQTEEAYDKTIKIIKTEQDLLELIDNTDNYKLKMKYRVSGKTVILSLRINPIDDSYAIRELKNHTDLFKDFSTTERVTYDKAERGEPLNPEELKMLEHINKTIESKAVTDDFFEKINLFLAYQVELEETNLNNISSKISFWKKISPLAKISLYNKVRDILNITETQSEDLFLVD